MNLETKVGLFVLLGMIITGVGVLKLSDIRFEKRYHIYFIFEDVGSLREKSLVKIAGVEVGRVGQISLENGKAKIRADIANNVPIYANAKVKVKLTGIIGTQFLDLRPGTNDAPTLKDGDVLYGDASVSLDMLIQKLTELIDGKDGKPGVGDDLRATFGNLRNISNSLNAALGLQKTELVEMVQNMHQFTGDLAGMGQDLHDVTSSRKEDIKLAIENLKKILERVDLIMAQVQRGEGAVGRLISDKEMGDEVKKTVSNLKQTSESAKDVLARFTKFRSFWEFDLRAVPGASVARGDGGIRLEPRENKYYYLGVNNAGDRKDEYKNANDYEKKNTVTAVLGRRFGAFTLEAGAIRSTAGGAFKYAPFLKWGDEGSPYPWLKNIELEARAFDFTRNEKRGVSGQERQFNNPQFNLGANYKLNSYLKAGVAVEDLAEVRQYNMSTHLVFEDRDLAYLFGFVSFAR